MGNEGKCIARIDGKRHEGKALLETSELLFRGAECRVKINFAEMRGVTAEDGELRFNTKDGSFAFRVGSAAEKWRDKILHPKSRIEKLGVKPRLKVAVLGEMDGEFRRELKQGRAELVTRGNGADLIFLGLNLGDGLSGVAKAAKQLQGAAGLWVLYPKGKKELTEADVIGAGRNAGLKDVKVVGFSATHTALKFVIPLAKR